MNQLTANQTEAATNGCCPPVPSSANVKDLELSYPQLLSRSSAMTATDHQGATGTTSKTGTHAGVLDWTNIVQACQTLSSEILLDKLLASLMKILIENAGAEKGFLVLETKGELLIEAEGAVNHDKVTVLQSLPIGGITGDTPSLSASIVNYVNSTQENVVVNDATHEGNFINDPYILEHQPKSILCAPLINRGKLCGIVYLENNLSTDAFSPERLEILNFLLSQAAISLENARTYNNMVELNAAYSRFVPREFIVCLDKESMVDVKLGDTVQKDMSVLFSEIRDYTALSESMTLEDNFNFFNAYLSRMEPAIIENHGFIHKYTGDAIMALFSGSADDAVKAGIAMLHQLTEYNQHRVKDGYVPIQIGIGINTGSVMLGTLGSHNRMQGTVISDAVNLASRIQSLTKNYRVSFLISHQTFWNLQDSTQYAIRLIEGVEVQEQSEKVTVFEVFDGDPLAIREGKLVTARIFEQALVLYSMQKFSKAEHMFQYCLRLNPLDKVAQIYLERCQNN